MTAIMPMMKPMPRGNTTLRIFHKVCGCGLVVRNQVKSAFTKMPLIRANTIARMILLRNILRV